jgi:two-component system, LytTR family, response regulator
VVTIMSLKTIIADDEVPARQKLRQLTADESEISIVGEGASMANGGSYNHRIISKSQGRILFLPVRDIRWLSAEENYVRICMEQEEHLLRETMAHLEAQLDPALFIRIHRSTIVNLQYVKEIRTNAGSEPFVLLRDGRRLPLSRRYGSRIAQLIGR